MSIPISSIVPNADDLLALEVDEVAGVLLVHLNSCGDNSGDSVVQNGLISQTNFQNAAERIPVYSTRKDEVNRTLMEAWNWLQSEVFLVKHPHHDWFFLSRRAKRLQTRAEFDSYRKASLFPKGSLHPLVVAKVYPAFLRGEYDTAVFQAFREVEVAVRDAGNFPSEAYGTVLMRDAFRADNPQKGTTAGPLTDTALPTAEQEGMASLFAGAIALYKNPQSHRNVPTEAIDAAEVLVLASHLLRTVDRLASKRG